MVEQPVYRTPPSLCPCCGNLADACGTLPGPAEAAPADGDLTLCIECGALLRFGPVLQLLIATAADEASLDPEQAATIARTQRFIRGRGRRPVQTPQA